MGAEHDAFQAFWESGGPWPPLALSVIVGIVTLTVGLMLVYHGTSMSSSPLILCSVTGLLIGLALTVVLPQALERLMTVMPSERIFIIFILAPLAMFIWEHVVLDHQHIHPLADGSTAGCGEVGCDDGCDRLVLAAGDLRAGDLRAGAARSAPAATCFHWMEAKFSVHSPCVSYCTTKWS